MSTGSQSLTLASPTQVATGGVPGQQATLASPEPDTAGTVIVSGSQAATLAEAQNDADFGVSAQVLASVVASTDARLYLAGVQAATLVSPVAATAGGPVNINVQVVTLPDVEQTQEGVTLIGGAQFRALAGVSRAQAGEVGVVGAQARTLAPPSAATAGQIVVEGSQAITLDAALTNLVSFGRQNQALGPVTNGQPTWLPSLPPTPTIWIDR
jgi:hypothetical protein